MPEQPTNDSPPNFPVPPRELIVVAEPEAKLRATRDGVASAAGLDVEMIDAVVKRSEMTFVPLFGESEERLAAAAAMIESSGVGKVPDLSLFYCVEGPDDRLDDMCTELCAQDGVAGAYIKPPAEPPVEPANLSDDSPAVDDAPPATPDFSAMQGYLDAAPDGVNARHAWAVPGGGGSGVRVIDVEGAWRFTHEDLRDNQGGVIGTQTTDRGWRNHGTAVVGVVGGDRSLVGITGISPDANTTGVTIFGVPEQPGPFERLP